MAVAGARMRGLLYARRIRHQAETASRRLQELLFECYGEIEKACRRSALCTTAHRYDSDARMCAAAATLRWRIFLRRLEADSLGALRLHDLDIVGGAEVGLRIGGNAGEATARLGPPRTAKLSATAAALIPHCRAQLHDALDSDQQTRRAFDVHIERCVLVCHAHSKDGRAASSDRANGKRHKSHASNGSNNAGGRGGKRPASTRPPVVSTGATELKPLLDTLFRDTSAGVSISADPANADDALGACNRLVLPGTPRLPRYPATNLLSGHVLSWLSLFRSLPVDCRVYYCVEERLLRTQTERPGRLEQKRPRKDSPSSPTNASRGSTRVSSAIIDFLATVYGGNTTNAGVRAVCGSTGGVRAAKLRWHVRRADGRHRHHYLHHHRVKQAKHHEGKGSQHDPSHLSTVSPDVLVAEAVLPAGHTSMASLNTRSGHNPRARVTENEHEEFTSLDGRAPISEKDCEPPRSVVTLHFAPAMVHHIMETDRFVALNRYFSANDRAVLNGAYPEETVMGGALSTLFIAVPPSKTNPRAGTPGGSTPPTRSSRGEGAGSVDRMRHDEGGASWSCQGTPNPLVGARLMPLPDVAVDELTSVFVIRNTTATAAPPKRSDSRHNQAGTVVPAPAAMSVLPVHPPSAKIPGVTGNSARGLKDASPVGRYSLVYNLPRDAVVRAVAVDNRAHLEEIEIERLAGGTFFFVLILLCSFPQPHPK